MLIRHSATYFGARVVSGACSLVGVALYTRFLSADEYGHYALIMAATITINAVVLHWLSLSLGRLMAARETGQDELLSTALAGYLALVLVTAVIGGVIASFYTMLARPIMLAMAISWAQAWFDLNLALANARLTPTRYGVVSSAKAIVGLAVGFALIVLGAGYLGPLLGLLTSLLFSPFPLRHQWRGVSFRRYRFSILKDLIAYGAPLTLTFVMIMVLDVSDRFLIGWLMSPRDVGVYAAAYDLANQSLGALLSVVHLAAFPLAVRAFSMRGPEGASGQLEHNVLLLTAIALPATAGLVLLADNIAFTLLGSELRGQAANIIPLIAIAVCVWGIKAYYVDYAFQLKKRLAVQIWPNGVAAVLNIALNLLLIPRLGVIGAAWATLAAYCVGALLSCLVSARFFVFPPFPRDIYKVFAAVSGMAGVLLWTRSWRGPAALALQIAAGFAVYVALMVVFNIAGGWSRLRGNLVLFKGKEL